MKDYIKALAVLSIRFLLRLGFILPVRKKRILFSAGEGRQFSCNPKYIFEDLYKSAHNHFFEFIWVLNDPQKLPAEYRGKVKTVKFLSLKHILALLTSGTIVSNLGIEPILPKRRSQTFINTWHGGGAYKVVSSDMGMYSPAQRYYARLMRDLRSKSTDIFLSSCRRFTEVSARDFNIGEEKFVATGLPRNDRFFSETPAERENHRKDFMKRYGIPEENMLVLYAPTFRGNHHSQSDIDNQVCCKEVAEAISQRFGRPVSFLFRSHISKESPLSASSQTGLSIIDMTSYPDMQDLLDYADVLITDYSSSIWDYSLTGKPAFLFTPDLAAYLADRGFYTPIERWPFTYAESVEQLCGRIREFSEKDCKARIERHWKELGSYEEGKATESVSDIILNRL